MALESAALLLESLASKGKRCRVHFVSDSQYLVKGITEWVHGWKRRGWRRKGGEVENLDLWQRLDSANQLHETTFQWVKGHAGHAKNEYVNDLAIESARTQSSSSGIVESGFLDWLRSGKNESQYATYDPDADFTRHETENR